ncbi:MAG: hypothetical protein ACRDYD_06650 [Acidimicrobiales bacterium]
MARAAATGGGRTRRGQLPMGWYSSLAVIVVLGLATVAWSRYQARHPTAAVQPTVGTHWLAAYAIDVCGKVQPPLPKPSGSAKLGITTTGDGLIHIDPKTAADAGRNATLGRFVAGYPHLELSQGRLALPGRATLTNGHRCGTKAAKVVVQTWSSLADPTGQVVTGNPGDLRLANGQLITIGFVAPGTKLPRPPSAAKLASTQTPTTTTAPKGSSTSTTAAGHPTITTAPKGSSTSTTAAGHPTTTKPPTPTTAGHGTTTTKP